MCLIAASVRDGNGDRRGIALNGAIALAAMACAALPLHTQVGTLEITAVVGVAAASFWTFMRAVRNARVAPRAGAEPTGESEPRSEDRANPLSRLLTGILPVWLQHVRAVKVQTEEAVNQLATSFSSISEQFEVAGFQGASGSATERHDTTISLLTLCERQLQPVIRSMTSILDGKDALLASVRELSAATSELQGMATGVGSIAAQTNLLAINAAIEAARVGVAGRGFAVIAKEIRNLSQMSAQTGKQVTERMAHVTRIMESTVEAAANASAHDKTAIELSGSVIEDVLTHVRELSVDAEKMRAQGGIIRNDIENLLVNLQFQDRVSQIISVIDGDVSRLRDVVASEQTVPEPDAWLSALGHHYTMDDQRHGHGAAGPQEAAAAPVASEVQFF